MMLGQLIQHVLNSRDLYLDQLGVTDLVLLARINSAADARGLPPSDIVARAVQALLNSDDDGTWATLMGRLQGSDTPGLAFIDMAVRRYLENSPAPVPSVPHPPPSPAPRGQGGCGGGGGCGCGG